MEKPSAAPCFLLEDWLVTPSQNLLQRDRQRVVLEPKAMNVLCHLVEHADLVVSADQLLTHCWPGDFFGDNVVHKNIAVLRKALGEPGRKSRYIMTVSKRGYRLLAPVRPMPDQATVSTTEQALSERAQSVRSQLERVRYLLNTLAKKQIEKTKLTTADAYRLRRHNAWLLKISERLLDYCWQR